MPDHGFLPLYRKFFSSQIWELDKNEPYHKREAWLDLLQMAQYKDGPKLVNYQNVELKKGQVLTSILQLSEKWGWSRVKVRQFLYFLETVEKNIRIENKHHKGRRFTVITLLNYSFYHDYNFKKDTELDTQKTLKRHSKDTYNKDNKDNNNTYTGEKSPERKKRVYYTLDNQEINTTLADRIVEIWNEHSRIKEDAPTQKTKGIVMGILRQTTVEKLSYALEYFWKIVKSPRHQDFNPRPLAGFLANDFWKQFLKSADPVKSLLKPDLKPTGREADTELRERRRQEEIDRDSEKMRLEREEWEK